MRPAACDRLLVGAERLQADGGPTVAQAPVAFSCGAPRNTDLPVASRPGRALQVLPGALFLNAEERSPCGPPRRCLRLAEPA
jgi:hypothetical protein